MAKTKRLSVYCNQARSFASDKGRLIVHLEQPDVKDALLSFHSDDLIYFVSTNYAVEEMYNKKTLQDWAAQNGYVKQ